MMPTTTISDMLMADHYYLPLAATAVAFASMHALAPDHWMPLAALARAQCWSAARTARVTAACGFAHVSVSVAIGLVALAFGVRLFERFGPQLESLAGVLLIGFGVLYSLWGLQHAAAHLHGHSHSHYDHLHQGGGMSPWTIFLVFAADPCLAIFPLMFAAAPLGWAHVAGIIVLYEAATIVTMTSLVLPARAAANALVRGGPTHRYGDALAGGFIVAVGVTVAVLGW
jgi:nickel/cobalt transporter (NicO) family protein